MLKCLRKSFSPDTQKVGLEAAILERKRNSSLDEGSGVENVSRLKASAEAAGPVRSTGKFEYRNPKSETIKPKFKSPKFKTHKRF